MKETNSHVPDGIRRDINNFIGNIDYADGICLLTHNFFDMEAKLMKLSHNANKVGLQMHFTKTKQMRISSEISRPMTMNGITIKDVTSFNYLGCIRSKDSGSAKDIIDGINKARSGFMKFCGDPYPNSRKQKKIFNSSCTTHVLHGALQNPRNKRNNIL